MEDKDGEGCEVCPGCGRRFECGMRAGRESCWCADLPSVPIIAEPAMGCFCPECLARRLAEAAPLPGK